jgi:UDP-N-acetylglucosamine 4,6-dehydratase
LLIGIRNIMLRNKLNFFFELPFNKKILLLFIFDIFLNLFSSWVTYVLKVGYLINILDVDFIFILSNFLIFLALFKFSNFYFNHSRYLDIETIFRINKLLLIYLLITVFFHLFFPVIRNDPFPRAVIFMQPIFFFSLVLSSRIIIFKIYKYLNADNDHTTAYIIGSEYESFLLYNQIKNNNYNIKGFIDPNSTNINRKISNLPIFNFEKFSRNISNNNIFIFFSNNLNSINIKNDLINYKLIKDEQFILIPNYNALINHRFKEIKYKEINIDKILSRNINFNKSKVSKIISNKTILITGAGGSIGSEISLQLIKMKPKIIIFIDNSEFNLFQIKEKIMKLKIKNIKFFFQLTSITNYELMEQYFKKYKFDVIYHAAAYKHVPIVEDNVLDAVSNNVFGTYNLIKLSIKYKVNNFTLISSDKAVRSKNLMGLTKRFSELIVQAYSSNNKKIYNIVRFGNVIGSSGSVINTFYDQIKNGENLTVTHQDIIRYFMSIKEAVGLVLESSVLSKGGEVFLLDMGEPIKIVDLAKQMILMSGLKLKTKSNPNGDIKIIFTGLRPGEKLFEELLIEPNSIKTNNKYIYKASEPKLDIIEIDNFIKQFYAHYSNLDKSKLIKLLKLFTDFPKK